MEDLTLNVQLSDLALKIRNFRIGKGLTAKELSILCKVSEADIMAFETDKKVPTNGVMERLLKFLSE